MMCRSAWKERIEVGYYGYRQTRPRVWLGVLAVVHLAVVVDPVFMLKGGTTCVHKTFFDYAHQKS